MQVFGPIMYLVWSKGLISISVSAYQVVPESFVEETLLSPLNCPGIFVEKQLTIIYFN